MKRVVIFLNGSKPNGKIVKKHILKKDIIVCADGGVDHAFDLKLKPHIVIGDFDSLSKKSREKIAKENIPVIAYSQDKDETDSELVVRFIESEGFEDVVIFGWMGSRLDHVMANLLLLANLDNDIKVKIIERDQILYLIRSSLKLNGKKGDFISLIPLIGDTHGVKTRGLKWALKGETLFLGKTRGISNEFIATTAEISIGSGVLLVTQHLSK